MVPTRQLSAPAYFTALLLIVVPLLDVTTQIWPVRLHDVRWRFGTFGLVSGALLIPLVGLLLALSASVLFDHHRLQRVIGALSLLASVATLAFVGVFALDALQLRGQLQAPVKTAFGVASSMATIKAILGAAVLGLYGFAGFRGPKSQREARPASKGLIIGTRHPVGSPANGTPGVSHTPVTR